MQCRFRLSRRFKARRRLLDDERAARDKIEHARRNAAARFIQKNWKNRLFNGMMAPFVLFCCVYHRNECDERLWSAIQIQKIFRGFRVRVARYRASERFALETRAATRIQSHCRRFLAHKTHKKALATYRRVYRAQRRFAFNSRPRLRLGKIARVIQRSYRLYLFHRERFYAAAAIQRVVRKFVLREKWRRVVAEGKLHHTLVLQRAGRRFAAKLFRRNLKNRQHMAAYRIYLAVDKFFEVQRVMRRQREAERQERDRVNEWKKQKVLEKRSAIFQKIKERYHHTMARRIQKAFRKYKYANTSRMDRSQSSRSGWSQDDSMTETSASNASFALIAAVTTQVLKPFRAIKDNVAKVARVLEGRELIAKGDEKKFTNAVLKYQLKSIVQEGVVDIHITVGEPELRSFESMQLSRKNSYLPYFTRLPRDLSGDFGLNVFFWTMQGKGNEVICKIIVQPRPDNTSNAGMTMRAQLLEDKQHIKLAWHPHIHFEIQGSRSIKQGLSDFAIRDVVLTSEPEEEDELHSKEYICVCNFRDLGFSHLTMWCSSRKLEDEEVLFKFSRLTANHWCDERLIRAVKAFNLSEDDVTKFRRTFDNILNGRNRETLKVEDLFEYIDFPFNKLCKWSVKAINPTRKKDLLFSEYVHYVSYFVMLSARDLAKFLFQHADEENNYYLRREQFSSLLGILAEGSPFNVKAWEYQYEQFHDKKLTFQFVTHFEEFVKQNPGVLWQPQLLQQKLMKANLGKAYWDTKIEQYRVMREQLNITLR